MEVPKMVLKFNNGASELRFEIMLGQLMVAVDGDLVPFMQNFLVDGEEVWDWRFKDNQTLMVNDGFFEEVKSIVLCRRMGDCISEEAAENLKQLMKIFAEPEKVDHDKMPEYIRNKVEQCVANNAYDLSPEEYVQTYLMYEGIFGYTAQIIDVVLRAYGIRKSP